MFDALTREIAGASTGEFWCALAATLAAACWLLRQAYRLFAHRRLIQDMPTTRLRATAQGYVELTGTARLFDGEPIVAPLTGRACCWFRYRVEHRERGRGRNGRDHARWREVDGGESTGIFMLDDGTGRCAVDPEGASITPSIRQIWYGRSAIPPRPKTHRSWWSRLLASQFGGDFRYREETIDIGAPIYALGFFRTHGGAATPADTSGEASSLLREWKADQASLMERFDSNRDGSLDATEWERARLAAHAEVGRLRASRSHAPPAVDMLSRPLGGGQPYILAAAHEQDLTEQHAWSGSLCLGIGTFLGMGFVWALAIRLVGPV